MWCFNLIFPFPSIRIIQVNTIIMRKKVVYNNENTRESSSIKLTRNPGKKKKKMRIFPYSLSPASHGNLNENNWKWLIIRGESPWESCLKILWVCYYLSEQKGHEKWKWKSFCDDFKQEFSLWKSVKKVLWFPPPFPLPSVLEKFDL